MPLMFPSTRARARSEAKEMRQETMSDFKLQALKDVQQTKNVHDLLEHGKSLRCRSAKAIEFQLRTEALKNLSKSQTVADMQQFQRGAVNPLWGAEAHGRLILERTKTLIDENKLTQPLNLLSQELRGYEQKSSNYFLDKRYQDRARRQLLNGCRGCEYYNVNKRDR